MRAGGDPQRDSCVTEVMRAEMPKAGCCRRRHSEPPAPNVKRHITALGCREDEILGGAGEGGQVLAEGLGSDPGERNAAVTRPGLGRPEVEVAPDVDDGLDDGYLAPKNVDPLGPEAEELAGPQTAIGGGGGQRPDSGDPWTTRSQAQARRWPLLDLRRIPRFPR